jgi:hypothetical protein
MLSALGRPQTKLDRQVEYERTVIRTSGSVAAARETAKVEAIARVTEVGLVAASHVSALEVLLIGRTPHAEARLRHIADAGVAGMANVVLGVERNL